MRQKSGPEKQPAEDAIRDIRRATRRHFSAEEKIRVVLEGLRVEESIAELCRREGIASSMYYGWSKEFLEAGKRRLAGDTARAATSDEVKDLRREAQALKEVVADLTLENRLLKNVCPAPFARVLIESAERSVCFNVSGLGGYPPGQDGDTRAPVLIKHSASSAAFLTRLPERRSTVRPSRYRHSQTSSIEQRPHALSTNRYAATGNPLAAKGSPRRSTAQAILASLLANATTTTLGCARLNSDLAHRPSGTSRSAT